MRKNFNDFNNPISLADVMLKVLLMVFLAMTILALVAKKNAEEGNVKKKAEFQIKAEWNKNNDPNLDCDVDLWVKNPEGQIVYWRSKENAMMNIERDDIGSRNDTITNASGEVIHNPEDAEYWYLRAIVPGEYSVNLHLYACKVGENYASTGNYKITPFPVEVRLTKLNPKAVVVDIETTTLKTIWDETTVFNFTLGASGEVTRITHIPVRMVNASQSGNP